jgi:hypothetical protein
MEKPYIKSSDPEKTIASLERFCETYKKSKAGKSYQASLRKVKEQIKKNGRH